MILEAAALDVKPGQSKVFESAFAQAQKIISASPGYLSHELRRCCAGMRPPNPALHLTPGVPV